MMKKEWTYKKLGEVATITMGQSPSSDTYNESEGLPFFQGNADFGKEHPNVRLFCNAPIRIAVIDDVLISVRAPIGAINIADRRCCIGRGLASLRGNENYQSRFVYYFLMASKEKLVAQGTGSTFKSIGKDALYNLLIPVVSLYEQSQIVKELDLLQSIIDKQKAQLKELDNLAQAVFYDMFGDPVENEKGWDVKKLGTFCSKIGSGATPRGGNESYKTEGISLIRSLNVHNNEFVYKDLAFIDEEQARALSNVDVQPNDILLNITGASVARCCVVPDYLLPARVNQHVCIIRPINDVEVHFLSRLLTNAQYQAFLIDLARGKAATREALPKNIVEGLPVIIPPLSLQHSFAAKIESIEKQKAAINKSIEESQKLFDYTMDKYFG